MREITLLLLLFLSNNIVYPANDNAAADAVSLGLGGTSVVLKNVYASYNNQAVLALIKKPTLAASCNNKFSLVDTRVMAIMPFSHGAVGFSVSRLGSSFYSELKMGGSFSRRFGDNFSASLQTDILSITSSPNEKNNYNFTAEIGLWARPEEDLTIGFHIYNFINARYEALYYDESIPVNMKLGLGYTIFDDFLITAEIENSSLYGTSVRGGMEYHVVDQVVLRTGGASNPALASIGLGVILGSLHIDIAAQTIRYIGKTGAVSLSHAF